MFLFRYHPGPDQQSFNLLNGRTFEIDSPLTIPPALQRWKKNLRVVGSCRGVVCVSELASFGFNLYLCNPSIWKYRTLPPSGINVSLAKTVFLGFAYHSQESNFKVVRLTYGVFRNEFRCSRTHGHDIKVELYSFVNNSWKDIEVGFFPWYISTPTSELFVAESLHWKVLFGDNQMQNFRAKILAFDFRDESFREISVPSDSGISRLCDLEFLGVFRGLLGVLSYCPYNEGVYVGENRDLWVMNEYGNPDSWTKLYTITLDIGVERPLMFTEAKEIIFLNVGRYAFVWNSVTRNITYLGVRVASESDFFIFTKSMALVDVTNEPIQV
ncbi:OLC1v1002052C1 [Oldenlandia corymbosa var. corymbosa]|uniref:OLC1v1002052C1 n=1 Tax=Oldenlandia corymbosa var. corymbosa TaxID=529605 RepID=A0AAV1D6P9_OLDCO|nr:OLC1v1002052C1 [Oldenlandia corymbosa var. corymbosa]